MLEVILSVREPITAFNMGFLAKMALTASSAVGYIIDPILKTIFPAAAPVAVMATSIPNCFKAAIAPPSS